MFKNGLSDGFVTNVTKLALHFLVSLTRNFLTTLIIFFLFAPQTDCTLQLCNSFKYVLQHGMQVISVHSLSHGHEIAIAHAHKNTGFGIESL